LREMQSRVRWEAACEIGGVREANEDAWGATTIGENDDALLLAVADGMGGHPGGKIASHLAVESCMEEAKRSLPDPSVTDWLVRLFQAAKHQLAEHAEAHPSMRWMGTTLTLLLLQEDGGWVGHVGDSRVLWLRGKSVGLVTRDHSAAWERVERGTLSVDDAERDPMGSLLTRHLGPFAPCEPDIFDLPLAIEKGDRLLLCSDGLGKVVGLEQIINLTAHRTVKEAVARLIKETLAGGGPDNVTVVLAEALAGAGPNGPSIDFQSLAYRFPLTS